MKPIGIIANVEKPQVPRVVKALLQQLKRLRQSWLMEAVLARDLGMKNGVTVAELGRKCRLIVVLGGDGTVLRVARELRPHSAPLFPVNLGKLGFLATVSPGRLATVLAHAVKGKCRVVEHSTLDIKIQHGREVEKGLVALNDVVISRGAVSRVVELELRIDGGFVNSYVCDGMIFGTPTGSTAYSLSAGGPIILPGSRVYVITPICPHTLSNRSVIVDDRSEVEIRILSQPKELFLGLDGQTTIRLNPGDRVKVTIGRYKVRMITPPESSFFELLRRKLKWSGSNI